MYVYKRTEGYGIMELTVEKGIIIDIAENVAIAIEGLTGKKIKDIEIVKKFIAHEKATKYYIDAKLNSKMALDGSAVLLWADTGYVDTYGNAIFISFRRHGNEFRGHITGNIRMLTDGLKHNYPQNKKYIESNYQKFINKYKSKIDERENRHIYDEKKYYVGACNEKSNDETSNTLGKLIKNLNVTFENDEIEVSAGVEKTEKNNSKVKQKDKIKEEFQFNEEEKEITLSLMFDEIQRAQALIHEQLEVIKALETELDNMRDKNSKDESMYKDMIRDLEVKVKERDKAMVQIRVFGQEEAERRNVSVNDKLNSNEKLCGHNLLARNKKILVLGGTDIHVEDMCGVLVKEFGYEKKDVDFQTDYNKIKSHGSSISNKYDAVIIGACPHSVKGLGDWNNLVDKLLADEFIPAVADARLKNGALKLSRESFKKAVWDVSCQLKARNEEDVLY